MKTPETHDRSTPIRLALALPSLAHDGGAERVMLALLARLDRSRFRPELILLDGQQTDLATRLDSDVTVHDLGTKRVRYSALPLIRLLHRLQPDALLTGLGHLNLMIATLARVLPAGTALIGRETSVVTEMNAELGLSRVRNSAYRRLYPSLDRVICQSRDMFDDLTGALAYPRDRACVIHNPVDVAAIGAQVRAGLPGNVSPWHAGASLRLLAVGRLAPQKGFDLLIDAIAAVPDQRVELAIIGQGELREQLAAQVQRHGLSDRVHLLGYQANPYPFMAAADAFVLSSRYEGMPNVVLEAMACGTPIIATPAPGGLREIASLSPGVSLAESVDAQALAHAIVRFTQEADLASVRPDVSAFTIEKIVPRYQNLISEAVAGRGRIAAKSNKATIQ